MIQQHPNTYIIPRIKLLENLKKRQSFRVAIGKNIWIPYKTFNQSYNLREVLDNQVLIEFDMPKDWAGSLEDFRKSVSLPAVNQTCERLRESNLAYEVWEHNGKSPHILVDDLPVEGLDKDQLKNFKKSFVRFYVPKQWLGYADFSLCGVHLVALEWAFHWKGCYGIKKLIDKWSPK